MIELSSKTRQQRDAPRTNLVYPESLQHRTPLIKHQIGHHPVTETCIRLSRCHSKCPLDQHGYAQEQEGQCQTPKVGAIHSSDDTSTSTSKSGKRLNLEASELLYLHYIFTSIIKPGQSLSPRRADLSLLQKFHRELPVHFLLFSHMSAHMHCLEIDVGLGDVHDNLLACEQAIDFLQGEVPGLGICNTR